MINQGGLLTLVDRGTVTAVASVVVFVAICKAYNRFIAKPGESYPDVAIAKMAIFGIVAVFGTRVAVTSLESRKALAPCEGSAPPRHCGGIPSVPELTRVVR